LEFNFNFTSSNHLCALEAFSLRKRLANVDIQCALRYFEISRIWGYDEFMAAKGLSGKSPLYQNNP
jgi:hypothetical protein